MKVGEGVGRVGLGLGEGWLFNLIALTYETHFSLPSLGMGGDVWMRQLDPMAPEGADSMHLYALRHLHSPKGGSFTKLKTPKLRER